MDLRTGDVVRLEAVTVDEVGAVPLGWWKADTFPDIDAGFIARLMGSFYGIREDVVAAMPVVRLTFRLGNNDALTTARRYSPGKERYYRGAIGEDFLVRKNYAQPEA